MQRELLDDKAKPYVNLVLANVSDTAEPLIIPFTRHLELTFAVAFGFADLPYP